MNRPLTAAEQQEQINQFSDYQIVQMCEHLDDTTLAQFANDHKRVANICSEIIRRRNIQLRRY